MPTANLPKINQALDILSRLSVDDKLAFLWFVYTDMGSAITPAAPGTAGEDIAGGLYNQVKEKSHDEQLQIQRDIANKKDTLISREYGSLGENTKLLFWYLLAQGMESGEIVPMPENYEMASEGQQLLSKVIVMEYEEQITFLREAVMPMGAPPKPGAEV
jgi:hypothetical protein